MQLPDHYFRELVPTGAYLDERFGSDFINILNLVVNGEIKYCSANPRRLMPLKPPPASAVETLFAAVNVPLYGEGAPARPVLDVSCHEKGHAITRSVPMTPTITAFEQSPDRGQGLARDMRVRWALEEVGQRYDVRLVSFSEMRQSAHRMLHPFGQIPTYEEGDLTLFESGAIIFRIAQRHAGLLPDDANARARALAWMFAALNTVEPPIVERSMAVLLERDKSWYEERLVILEDRVRVRLGELSSRLGDSDWLDGAFSAGDLLMVTVLRRLNGSGLVEKYPNLSAYVARGAARPAYKRAFADQLAVFTGKPPKD